MVWVQSLIREQRAYKPCSAAKQQQQQQQQSEAKYRKIKNPEWRQKFKDNKNVFYLISTDVGRIHDQTVACIFRVNI